MAPVQPRLQETLNRLTLSALKTPVVTNVEAAPNSDHARIIPLLVEQVTQSVRWVESVEALVKLGVTRFVELGPGKVLSGLVKRISRDVEIFNVEDPASLKKTLDAMAATSAV
jgi:[acyl-carrier-protein] S-malonyltransferase